MTRTPTTLSRTLGRAADEIFRTEQPDGDDRLALALGKASKVTSDVQQVSVIVYSGIDRVIAELYEQEAAGLDGPMNAALHKVTSAKQLRKVLRRYNGKHLEYLVIISHATKFGLLYPDQSEDFLIGPLFRPARIEQVRFEGCNLGESEPMLRGFARNHRAVRLSAYRVWHFLGYLALWKGHTVTLKGKSISYAEAIDAYTPYIRESSKRRFDEFSRGPQQQGVFLIEWFLTEWTDKMPHEVPATDRKHFRTSPDLMVVTE